MTQQVAEYRECYERISCAKSNSTVERSESKHMETQHQAQHYVMCPMFIYLKNCIEKYLKILFYYEHIFNA